ncbi:MAG: efflux RND transporter permease subunit [Xanthomonadales bacterium]|nr:Cobalt-zinc-cadmium resistance protein CzcA [Xanthomonadales bacterium]MCC6592177.1 efflux RND transporter permease subunit [Xanthomonadales bacterium]MCE7930316.1 efflux RND transporter permease subunit [Xanthomonadales bacterium PRO6]
MQFLEFPIRRYPFTLVAFLGLIALGIYSFSSIARSEDPYFPIPAFVIAVVLPGGDPVEMERLVAKPIEDRLAELDDVKRIDSTSADGLAVVVPEFIAGVDVARKYEEIVREVNALRPELPAQIVQLDIRKVNPGLVNIVQMALVSADAPYAELETLARELKDELKALPGIRTAESWAYPERELRVALDLKRLAELGLTPGQVVQAIQSDNANIPAGSIDIGPRSFALKTSGAYTSPEQVRATVISASEGRTVRVRDVAEVSWDTAEQRYLGRYSGKRAVFVTANQKDGVNIFDMQTRIDRVLERFEASLPARVQLERGFRQSENVGRRLDRLGWDFVIAIGLVLLTLLPLGLRAASVVMISIPLSLAIGLAGLYAIGYSLNQLSIAGFVVALGLLVDDSIVVVENIARFLREGHSRERAAVAATQQIFVAILGCTGTLLFAFLPLLALPGTAGQFIRVLPMAVVFTVLASLLVALTIIPFLASRMLPRHESAHGNRALQWVMDGIGRFYRPLLHRALARPKATVVAAMALFVASLGLVPVVGFSLFPKADTPQFLITITTPNGASIAETDRALRFVEDELKQHEEIEFWFSNLGKGNPKIYYNVIPAEQSSNLAEIYAQVKSYDPDETPAFIDELRGKLREYPNARIVIKEFENGPPIDAPIAIRVLGADLDVLKRLSAEVAGIIESVPGTRDVDNPLRLDRTDLKLRLDAEKAALLGVPAVDFDRSVRLAVSGVDAGDYREADGESYDIVVRTPIDGRPTLEQLDQVRVPSLSGALLPASQLSKLEFDRSPPQIQRYNRERTAIVSAYTQTGFNTDKLTREVIARLEGMDWPRGYRWQAAGEVESRAESFDGLGIAALVAVFGILAVLVLEFGSFRSTLIVATVIPLGVTGGLVALFLSGYSLSFTAMIGFIALVGIEIKNSILLVDFTNQLRAQGLSIDAAVERAGEVRFLPILLTSATAIGGLLPLAVQQVGMYSPMAWVIIGGLISSTLLARLVTPVMYKLLPPQLEECCEAAELPQPAMA